MTRSEMRHLEHKPTDYQFIRQSGLREWDFADYRPPFDWTCATLWGMWAAGCLLLAYFGWRML